MLISHPLRYQGFVYTLVFINMIYTEGDHTPLHFVTRCNNGVFNGGIYGSINISPSIFVDRN